MLRTVYNERTLTHIYVATNNSIYWRILLFLLLLKYRSKLKIVLLSLHLNKLKTPF